MEGFFRSLLDVSQNSGSTWQTANLFRIDLIRVAPMDPMVVYAIADHKTTLWKSTDGGRSFQQLRVPVGEPFTLAVSP